MASHRAFACLALAFAAAAPFSGAVTQEDDDAGTCDSSLLQHSKQKASGKASIAPSCAALLAPAHQVSIPVEGLENYIEAAGPGSGLPEVHYGIWWMDQTGYYQTRPDRPNDTTGVYETVPGSSAWYKSFPHNFAMFAPELLITFAGSKFDSETRCTNVSRRINQWTWANTTGNATGAPQWGTTAGYVMQFCWNEAMDEVTLKIQSCAGGGTTDSTKWLVPGQKIFVRPWGWERLNPGSASEGKVSTRYAVWQIVDGNGRRTKHYHAFVEFMKMRCWYGPAIQSTYVPHYDSPECTADGGYLVNLGDGTMVVGRPGGD